MRDPNLDRTIDNTYYANQKQQQTHFGYNSTPGINQQWQESHGPFGCSKIPGPNGENKSLKRPVPEPNTAPKTNPRLEGQAYLLGLHRGVEKEVNEQSEKQRQGYPSPMWFGPGVTPGPKGNPELFAAFKDPPPTNLIVVKKK